MCILSSYLCIFCILIIHFIFWSPSGDIFILVKSVVFINIVYNPVCQFIWLFCCLTGKHQSAWTKCCLKKTAEWSCLNLFFNHGWTPFWSLQILSRFQSQTMFLFYDWMQPHVFSKAVCECDLYPFLWIGCNNILKFLILFSLYFANILESLPYSSSLVLWSFKEMFVTIQMRFQLLWWGSI